MFFRVESMENGLKKQIFGNQLKGIVLRRELSAGVFIKRTLMFDAQMEKAR